MSQSDFLKRKRVSTLLKIDNQPKVFNHKTLLDYTQFQLENTILSTNQLYNQSIPAGKINVFSMEKNVVNCPSFIVCSGTDARPNRVLNFDYDIPLVTNLTLNWKETNALNKIREHCVQCPP